MTREQILNSISLKKRFCKDVGLPITVFDNPYFYQRLCILDYLFGCKNNFEMFCEELERFNSEQDYFEEYNRIKDNAINHLKSNETFELFNKAIFSFDSKYPDRDIYKIPNNHRVFISIDMKKANFSALKMFSNDNGDLSFPDIFDNCDTYEEWIGQFTELEHIKKSKYIRQVVFGNCNCKKQMTCEKYYTIDLLNTILPSIKKYVSVYSVKNDEIIFEIISEENIAEIIRSIYTAMPTDLIEYFRIEIFEIENITFDNDSAWIKKYLDGRIEFKCLNAEYYHQIVKYYNALPITEDDLVFYYNGRLGRYMEAVENPWEQKE